MTDEHSVPHRVALFFGWTDSPVWYRTSEQFGWVDLDTLPITAGLRQRLKQWNAHADRVLSAHNFHWPAAEDQAAHEAAGATLAHELRDELSIEVIYAPDGDVAAPIAPSEPSESTAEGAATGWRAYAPLSDRSYRPDRR